jgi:hypothetical protein
MPAIADPLDVGFLPGLRTTKITKCASPALLPLYLTTTHPLNGFWGCFYLVVTTCTKPVRAASTLAACG